MSDYTPIDYSLHSEYELAILRHHKLHLENVTPTDLLVRQREEFRVAHRQNQQICELRLDRIRSVAALR